jgi:hypothetical protein
MKINILDAHDRLKEVNKQSKDITECCEDLIKQRPFDDHAFYIYCHARTEDNGRDKRLIWQPRLTRPLPQTNSMLFKAYPKTGDIKVCWMIPAREMWAQYQQGKLTEHEVVIESIRLFENDRTTLEKPEHDDLTDTEIDAIYCDISLRKKTQSLFYQFKPKILAPF